ncbi:molybdopterin biosynthesis protein [Rhodophyticola sp. CCM32]|uniref:molybdopterin-binding protein n=1 Tax=Rhodophyticola sp. CCM32 TaxID=2916397 RepID=UPI00107FCD96|nr:molybdopterin-binding protein [Rhodophyticola sp. CCM32]QBX99779.1 molybdopterin biosynthesis protein [Rhodophyticola sp. CCM32]
MKFGPVAVDEAEGSILAHSLAVPGGRLRKGRVLTAGDLDALHAAGLRQVSVARLEPGDVDENSAAAELAAALVPVPEKAGLVVEAPFTGRVNIRATGPGIVGLEAPAIAALNAIDPMITLATLPLHQRVSAGMMVGTVKIISYAVPRAALDQAKTIAKGGLWRVPVARHSAVLIVTEGPGTPANAGDKGVRAVAGRLEALGVTLSRVEIVAHAAPAIAAALVRTGAGADMALILTASATSDAGDVAPAALIAAGGQLTRFGMPVDPGNLLFLGHLAGKPVIGLPGCARSPALNGADWVLERVACGLDVTHEDIAAMGVGGLLKEIPSRPQPRERRPKRG